MDPGPSTLTSNASLYATNKRRRLVTDGGVSARESSRYNSNIMRASLKFWYDEGNLILEVETTRYRVHQHVMQKHSPVFLSILLPHQTQQYTTPVENSQDGQVICIYNDTERDWDYLLGFVYEPFE